MGTNRLIYVVIFCNDLLFGTSVSSFGPPFVVWPFDFDVPFNLARSLFFGIGYESNLINQSAKLNVLEHISAAVQIHGDEV